MQEGCYCLLVVYWRCLIRDFRIIYYPIDGRYFQGDLPSVEVVV